MGRVEEGEVSLRVTLDRGGRILSQKGGFPRKQRGLRKGAKGSQQGEIKSKGIAPYSMICICVYKMLVLNVDNNLNCV
jgi:hypothetical protein